MSAVVLDSSDPARSGRSGSISGSTSGELDSSDPAKSGQPRGPFRLSGGRLELARAEIVAARETSRPKSSLPAEESSVLESELDSEESSPPPPRALPSTGIAAA